MSFDCFKEFPKEKVREVTIERDPHYKIDPDYKLDPNWTFFFISSYFNFFF